MVILFYLQGFFTPRGRDFFYVYRLKASLTEYNFYYVAKYPRTSMLSIEGVKSHMGQLAPRYCFARIIDTKQGPFHKACKLLYKCMLNFWIFLFSFLGLSNFLSFSGDLMHP